MLLEKMSPRCKGFYRDKAIIEAVDTHRGLDVEQIRLMFFPTKTGKRVAQTRLKKLVQDGRLKRWRYDMDNSYGYYLNKDAKRNLEHTIIVNWVYLWLSTKRWHTMESFEYEKDFGVLQSDAVAVLKNSVTNEVLPHFIEVDIAESGNRMDKVDKYLELFENPAPLQKEWWRPHITRFPPIVITTTTEKRKKMILAQKDKAKTNLRFLVYLVEEIKSQVLEGFSK